MNRAEYTKSRAGDRVVTTETLTNGYMVVPPGALMTVTRKRDGFFLRGDECEHCGVQPIITKVQHWQVELVRDGR